jgi:hypothetical protein
VIAEVQGLVYFDWIGKMYLEIGAFRAHFYRNPIGLPLKNLVKDGALDQVIAISFTLERLTGSK